MQYDIFSSKLTQTHNKESRNDVKFFNFKVFYQKTPINSLRQIFMLPVTSYEVFPDSFETCVLRQH